MTSKDDPGPAALARLLASLHVERLDDDRLTAVAPAGSRRRIFGGVAMGQAVAAATIGIGRPDLTLRSLHCDFLRPGIPGAPVVLRVMPASGGRTSSTCRVESTQDGTLLSNFLLRFHAAESGVEYQSVVAPTGLPDPESLADYPTVLEPHRELVPDWRAGDLPIDVRMIPADSAAGSPPAERQRSWFRAAGPLGVDALHHCCVAIYASDMTLLGSAALPFGRTWASPATTMATLDHAMWFHRLFRADEWMLYDQRVIAVAGGRALVTGSIFTAAGDLAMTVVQDGLARFG